MKGWLALLALAALAAALVVGGIVPRLRSERALAASTDALAAPTVAVVAPQPEAAEQAIVLPATVDAYTYAPIYAQTSGYLTRWYHDIGDRVQAGQPLADIATPEVDQELRQAKADLATAQANLKLAQITNQRYQSLLTQDGVSQQDADNAAGNDAARQSAVRSAEANVERLTALEAFNQVKAPFNGVVTARNIDIGDLVNADSGHALFSMAAIGRLRVYVSMPQEESALAKPGIKAELIVPQFPTRQFPAVLLSTADAIDPATRTLLVQFLVDNPDLSLLPGSYGEVHIDAPGSKAAFLVPVSALLFRSEGPRLVLVENGRAHLLPIVLGRDYGVNLEVLSGLTVGEEVVTNPPDSVVEGEALQVGSGQ